VSLDPLGALRAVIEAISESGASYAVIGAVARNAWAPPRATTDLDCAVSVDAAGYASLLDALARRGFSVRKTVVADPNDSVPDVVLLDNPTMLVRRTDLLVAKTPFERDAVAQAVSRDVGATCRVVRPEHLVVYKLIANRPRDIADAEEVVRTRDLAGQPFDLELVRRWAVDWGVDVALDDLLRRVRTG
jgi:hypothetical protein